MYSDAVKKQHAQRRINNINNLCIFLKLLWEQTHNNPEGIRLESLANDYKIANHRSLIPLMQEKGIIRKIRSKGAEHRNLCYWQWISKTEPNVIMSTTLYDLSAYKHNQAKHKMLWIVDIHTAGYTY